MLSDVKRIIAEGHLGVRTYEEFAQSSLQKAAQGGEDAVALFVLAKIVQPFCDYYFDQALSEATAVAFRQEILETIEAYEAAGSLADKNAVLARAVQNSLANADV
ncbi:hypothetical protein [Jiella pacifica]|uniref:Uncharacterized protein n=1 Tax=Jiella pacifica TaxID=2696469 RepID=A0A6N9SX41_9HYPH|nr:hypothetical protein [Jiella pacifica]NDW03670.1 hypothetical protein [Jiella pacifica]